LDKIEVLADRNPKEYWTLVNSIKTNQTSQMPSQMTFHPVNGLNISKI
jgi:hypothetical protein